MSATDGRVLGATQIVDNGPVSARWNLVILGDGYQEPELDLFAADARGFVDALFARAPFDAMQGAVNVFRVDVASTDSGADDPAACGGTGAVARTYFDASYCNLGHRRLLVVDDATALAVADAHVPAWHAVIVVVNSPVYGGSGGVTAVYSCAPGANEIALHELGHSAFGLADEYPYYIGCGEDADADHHPPVEPAAQNVTTRPGRDVLKWRDLVAEATPLPTTVNRDCACCDEQPSPVPRGTVGAFEGAHYHHCGAYRPEFDCLMRELGRPFCAVCRRIIARALAPFMPLDAAQECEWLTALYADVLGRAPDPAGFAAWISRRNAGASREEIAGAFVRSPEACARRIAALYTALLGRAPAPDELSGALARMTEQGAPLDHIERELLASDEYLTRARGR